MNPILLEVPQEIRGERVVLLAPRAGLGATVNAGIRESIDALRPWMPWAKTVPTAEESEERCRRTAARFILREELNYLVFMPDRKTFVGCCGVPRLDWVVPSFEIGYWVRTSLAGRGYVTEAVRCLTRSLFDDCQARRVEIRMDDRNERSWRVAERAGFALEAKLRGDSVDVEGRPRTTRVYAMTRLEG